MIKYHKDYHNKHPLMLTSSSSTSSTSTTTQHLNQQQQQQHNQYHKHPNENHQKSSSSKVHTKNISSCRLIRTLTFALALLAMAKCSPIIVNAADNLQSALQKLKISPDILSIPNVDTIRVELNGNFVKPGDIVPAKNFKDLKNDKITWPNSGPEARHTIIVLDLDRRSGSQPSNQTQIYNQFTSINLPGDQINLGQAIVAFEGPIVPCSPSTKHRILMLALHQDQNIDLTDIAYISSHSNSGDTRRRENFNLNELLRRHRLTPVAANAFQAAGEINGVCSGSGSVFKLASSGVVWMIMLVAMVTSLYTIMPLTSGISNRRS